MKTTDELLDSALKAMAELHSKMIHDDDDNCIIEPCDLREFVDIHAQLLFERQQTKGI